MIEVILWLGVGLVIGILVFFGLGALWLGYDKQARRGGFPGSRRN